MIHNDSEHLKFPSGAPIADRKMWDSCGNYCRIEMYQIGPNTFELYMHEFNDAIPTRRVGSIGELNNLADIWLWQKHKAGFRDQLPSYQPTHS